MSERENEEVKKLLSRRNFIRGATAGTVIVAFGGGLYRIADAGVNAQLGRSLRPDGRRRLPPGQRIISKYKDMGGQRGSRKKKDFRLRIHGEVERPYELMYSELLSMPKVKRIEDVHCVTGWSVLDYRYTGVLISDLAKRAGVRDTARYVILEAAKGYTANIPIAEAMKNRNSKPQSQGIMKWMITISLSTACKKTK